jgi:hypothetical protein
MEIKGQDGDGQDETGRKRMENTNIHTRARERNKKVG